MTTPGPLALAGSGEFLPAMADLDALMLAGRPQRVAVIPTAAALEGDAILRRWFDLAHSHYDALGATVVEVDVRDRAAAQDPAAAELLEGVGLIYLSGGSPGFLAQTLRDTVLARAIATSWRGGAGLAGCSAGAMALGHTALSVRGPAQPGLGLAGSLAVIPHFDRAGFAQRLAGKLSDLRDAPAHVVGIAEETAAVWLPHRAEWVVHGRAAVWVLNATPADAHAHAAGEVVALPQPLVIA